MQNIQSIAVYIIYSKFYFAKRHLHEDPLRSLNITIIAPTWIFFILSPVGVSKFLRNA